MTAPSDNSRSRAVRISSGGTSSNFSASGTNSSVGNPQWPSSMASVRAKEMPGAHPDHGSLLDAEFHGDGVGGLKADAADVARQSVGVLRHDLKGVGAIGLVDTYRPRRADTVLM